MLRRIRDTDLPPDAFSVVMATGIIAVAAHDHAYPWLSIPLGGLAAAVLVLLTLGLVVRIVGRPHSAVGEVGDPDVALRLFTSVAACAVLGVRFVAESWALWLLGAAALAAWLFLVPLAVHDVRSRPRDELRDHAHGAWLLPSVATAGIATTAADLAAQTRSSAWLVVGSVAWVFGLLIYCAVTSLIGRRAAASPRSPEMVTPDSWILMGALAIGTLAGDHLLAATHALGGNIAITSWVRPLTFATWIIASAWIPVLLYAEIWRVDQRIGSLRYTGVWWSAVFPLGMYSAATAATGGEFHIRALTTVSLVFFWVAFTVWVLVATGSIHLSALRWRDPNR